MLNARDVRGYPLQGYDFPNGLNVNVKTPWVNWSSYYNKPTKDWNNWKTICNTGRGSTRTSIKSIWLSGLRTCAKGVILSETPRHPEILLLCVRLAVEIKTQQPVWPWNSRRKRLNSVTGKTATKRYSNNISRMTEEVMMLPTKEFDQLVQYHKGEITDNAFLNKAGRLAAESRNTHVILMW